MRGMREMREQGENSSPLHPSPCLMPHAQSHLLRVGWVCLGATGAWDAGGLEIPGLIGLMPCPV